MISKISLIHISLSLSLSLLKLRNIEKLIYQKYLKILDLTTLFIADAPIKKTNKISFTSSESTLKYGSKNRPWPKGVKQKKMIEQLTRRHSGRRWRPSTRWSAPRRTYPTSRLSRSSSTMQSSSTMILIWYGTLAHNAHVWKKTFVE